MSEDEHNQIKEKISIKIREYPNIKKLFEKRRNFTSWVKKEERYLAAQAGKVEKSKSIYKLYERG